MFRDDAYKKCKTVQVKVKFPVKNNVSCNTVLSHSEHICNLIYPEVVFIFEAYYFCCQIWVASKYSNTVDFTWKFKENITFARCGVQKIEDFTLYIQWFQFLQMRMGRLFQVHIESCMILLIPEKARLPLSIHCLSRHESASI